MRKAPVGLAALLCSLAPAAAAQELAASHSPSTAWSIEATLRPSAQWIATDGDRRKYSEDYDALASGGSLEGSVSGEGERGDYFHIRGAVLAHERGADIDGAHLYLRAGRRDLYSLQGDFSRAQSFYDDSREGPSGAFPFTNSLGRDLETARTSALVRGSLMLGRRGRLALSYRHHGNEGDRSLLKGSVIEAIAPVAFRFPAFQTVDVRSDAIDAEAALPAGRLTLRLSASYTDEHKRATTREANFAAASLRDRASFTDDIGATLARAAASVESAPASPVLTSAGYAFSYASSDGDATQATGETTTTVIRRAEGVSVIERSHSGHLGLALSPLRGLLVRAAYTILGQDREGNGSELRAPDVTSTDQDTTVRSDTSKRLLRHRPWIEVTYSGIPRTRVRASYRFERAERNLEMKMLGGAGDGIGPVDRIQDTQEDKNVHRVLVEARVRVSRRLLVDAGYRLRRDEIDETVNALLNEVTLGDRERDRDTLFARARLRPYRRTMLEIRAEYRREDFDRTDTEGLSKTSLDAEMVSAHAVTALTSRLLVSGLVSFANRDYDVGSPESLLAFFRPIEFRDRSTSGSVAASYSLGERATVRGQYNIVDAGGSLDNVNHRFFLTAAYRASERLQLGIGYAYLDFDEGLFSGDDYTTHAGWATASVAF